MTKLLRLAVDVPYWTTSTAGAGWGLRAFTATTKAVLYIGPAVCQSPRCSLNKAAYPVVSGGPDRRRLIGTLGKVTRAM